MKNLSLAKKKIIPMPSSTQVKLADSKAAMEAFASNKDMVMKGILWGVAGAALLISMVNIKTSHDAKVISRETMETITTAESTVTGQEVSDTLYEDLQTAVESELSNQLSTYINEYFSTQDGSVFFSPDTVTAISKQVEDNIITRVKETTTLTSAQETIIRQIIGEKIADIDYSDIEEEIQTAVTEMGSDSAKNLTDVSADLSREITAKVGSAVANISSGIADELAKKTYYAGEYVTYQGKLYQCTDTVTVTDDNIADAIRSSFKETSLTLALASMSSELYTTIEKVTAATNTSISNLDTSTSNKMKEMESLTNSKIDDLTASTDTRIAELTESTDSKVSELTESTDSKIAELTETTDSKISELTESTNSQISELTASVDTALADLSTTLTAEMESRISTLSATVDSNYQELKALTQGNANSISGLSNQLRTSTGTNFQFGYSNGAYGYYVGGTFYPF